MRTKRTDEEIANQLEHRDRSLDVWRSAAPLHRITDARNALVAAEVALAEAVRAARDDEYSWNAIGFALGNISKQAAQQRFGS